MQQHNQHEKFTCNENNLIRFMVIQIDENDDYLLNWFLDMY
jgi:hypothetical protein